VDGRGGVRDTVTYRPYLIVVEKFKFRGERLDVKQSELGETEDGQTCGPFRRDLVASPEI
jgi:hypothetical protein